MSQSGYRKSRGQSGRPRPNAPRESLTTNIASVFPPNLGVETILQLCRPPCIDMLNQFNTYTDEHIRELFSAPPQHSLQQPPYRTSDSSGYFPHPGEQIESHLPTSTSANPTSTLISPPTADWQMNPTYGTSRPVVSTGYGGSATPPGFLYFSNSTSSGPHLQRLQDNDPGFGSASGIISPNVHNIWPDPNISYTHLNPTPGSYLHQSSANPTHQPARQSRQPVPPNITNNPQEWRFTVNQPSPPRSQGTKTKVPCPELDCDKSYTSLPELREHCGAAHDKTRLSTCKHNNCGFRGHRDSIWRHHHTTDHKSCINKSKPEETCMNWVQLWQKQNWGCNVCPTGAFQSAHDWVTHYANHFQHQGKVDKDRSFSNLVSSLLCQKATQVFWQTQKAQQSGPMEWPEAAQQCQNLRRALEEGLYNGRSLNQPDVASMIVAWAVKLANELPHDTVAIKRRATSSPADSSSSGDLKSRRSYQ